MYRREMELVRAWRQAREALGTLVARRDAMVERKEAAVCRELGMTTRQRRWAEHHIAHRVLPASGDARRRKIAVLRHRAKVGEIEARWDAKIAALDQARGDAEAALGEASRALLDGVHPGVLDTAVLGPAGLTIQQVRWMSSRRRLSA